MTSLVLVMLAAQVAGAASCDTLKSLSLPSTTLTTVQLVPAGLFTPPAPATPRGRQGDPGAAGGRGRGGGGAAQPTRLPAHCRVAATLRPTPDSAIDIEVWLPAQNWNGKFQAVGNGGWAGTISYTAMATALQDGYATASTDTGHEGGVGDATWAIGHPEKLVDFAYRAVHEMTVKAKALIDAYYGRAPRFSYWNGCSTGGRQGLMAAQRYPEDFDGIVAGAPANYQTHLHAWDLAVSVPVLKEAASAVPAAKLRMVNDAVVKACDAGDGVTDGVLNDPRKCSFDVASLQCEGGSSADDCLTAPQVTALKRVYQPVKTSAGQVVFPGKVFGAEVPAEAGPLPGGFVPYVGGGQAPPISVGSFQVAYNDPKWDPRTFDLDRDLKVVDEKVGAIVNAVNPDLRAFEARGGKLIMYHGWHDTAISPGNAIDYLTSVQKRMGGSQDDFIRLFMAPGMEHCRGGVGPNQANWMAALERWRENGEEPDRIEAYKVTGTRVEMTRPLCPYPQVAVYKGSGSTNDAANFVCRAN